jgi:ATP-binding cassette, subfamily C, bacterial LapB
MTQRLEPRLDDGPAAPAPPAGARAGPAARGVPLARIEVARIAVPVGGPSAAAVAEGRIPTLEDAIELGPDAAPDPDDALLHALLWLTRHHGRERSPAALTAGLPLRDRIGPDQAIRALRDAGFSAGLIQRPVGQIHGLLFPVILLLRNGDACVVAARQPAEKGRPERYTVVMPGPDPHTLEATEADLRAEYSGVAIAATPAVAERPAARDEPALRDPKSHWLWGTLRRFMPYYRSAMLAALLSNVFMLVSGLTISVIYDKVIPHQAFTTLWALAIGSALALLFDLGARQLRSWLIDMAGRKTDLLVGSLLFRQTLGVRMEHRPASAGSFAHQLAQVEIVREFFASATMSAISDLPFVILFVAMIFIVAGPLGWVMVIAVPLILVLSLAVQGVMRRAMRSNMTHQADLQGVLVETLEGLEDVKASGAQGRFLHRYEEATVAAAAAAMKARNMGAWTNNMASTMQQVVTLVMLVWGVYLIHANQLTAGALMGAVMFAGRAVAPLTILVSLATRYQGARAAMAALDELMQLPTEREVGRSYVHHPHTSGRVGLADVSFAYPDIDGETSPTVLDGVSLRFESGERVAILGRIGSGKSTILRLLAGLYQPRDGMVEVDGMDLRQIDPADYRAKVGFVSQEPRLFTGTLRENVVMGRPGLDAAPLVRVARLTGLDRLVANHPKGWELSVGEMGALLSGGQRQLVALARCLITQPQIILMDEPTSSMDAQSETLFLRQLRDAVGACTLVMVTHRPAVLDLVDRIVVIDAGKVVMDGPKAQVLAVLSGAVPRPGKAPASSAEAARPAASPAAPATVGNVHRHPATQPVTEAAA